MTEQDPENQSKEVGKSQPPVGDGQGSIKEKGYVDFWLQRNCCL